MMGRIYPFFIMRLWRLF